MGKRIDFYFDFISPFAYLAHVKLPALARRYGASLHYHPVDVLFAKLAAGNYGPSTRQIPTKARYIREDRLRWAALYEVPMVSTLNATRAPRLNSGVFFANREGRAEDYVNAAFHQVWGVGADPEDDKVLQTVAQALAFDPKKFLAYVNSAPAQQAYAESRQAAHGRGVFGVPTMILDEQMFWGNDRLEFLEKYLAQA